MPRAAVEAATALADNGWEAVDEVNVEEGGRGQEGLLCWDSEGRGRRGDDGRVVQGQGVRGDSDDQGDGQSRNHRQVVEDCIREGDAPCW